MGYLAFEDFNLYVIPYSINTFSNNKFHCTDYIANRAKPFNEAIPVFKDLNQYLRVGAVVDGVPTKMFFRWKIDHNEYTPSLNSYMSAFYEAGGEEREIFGVWYGYGKPVGSSNTDGYHYPVLDYATGQVYELWSMFYPLQAGDYDLVPYGQITPTSKTAYLKTGYAISGADQFFRLNNGEYNPNLPMFPGPTSGDDDGPTEGTEGGGGTYQNPNDPIGITDPTGLLGALDTGLTSIYVPTLAQMQNFASALWDPDAIQWIETLFNKPLDAVLGLSIVPLTGISGSAKQVKIGSQVLTGVSMNVANSQYVQVNCGSITIKEFFGSCLDYAPYTKISLFLPYIGIVRLNTDDVMNKTITIVYNVDILSGACLAQVKCGNAVLYQYAGSCALNIPLSSLSFTNTFQAAVNIAATTVGAVAAIATGGLSTAANVGIAAAAVASTGASVMSAKPQIQHSGSIGGTAGMLGGQVPYIIREQPKQSLAVDYNTFVGYPCNITMNLSACAGFTQVEEVHLEGMTCTADEAVEIESLLKGGVII